jgi:hypothetical protein
MKRNPYFPSRISLQVLWFANYADKITAYALLLGYSAAEAAATVADARWLNYVLGAWLQDVRTFNASATAVIAQAMSGEPNPDPLALPVFTPPPLPGATPAPQSFPAVVPVPPGAADRVFAFVAGFKLAAGYTEAMGQDIGAEGSASMEDHPTPVFKVSVEQGPTCQCVDFSIFKYTHEGVVIESRRGGGAWEQIGVTTARTFEDVRALLNPAQPEVREYRLRYWDKGIANGDWSEVQKATVAP